VTLGGTGSNSATNSVGALQVGGGNGATGSTGTAQTGPLGTAPSVTLGGGAAAPPAATAASAPPGASATPSTLGASRTRGVTGAPGSRSTLGTSQALRRAATLGQLPLTGLTLWLFVLLGLTLTTLGLRIRKYAQV
jgi:hypothetical protein